MNESVEHVIELDKPLAHAFWRIRSTERGYRVEPISWIPPCIFVLAIVGGVLGVFGYCAYTGKVEWWFFCFAFFPAGVVCILMIAAFIFATRGGPWIITDHYKGLVTLARHDKTFSIDETVCWRLEKIVEETDEGKSYHFILSLVTKMSPDTIECYQILNGPVVKKVRLMIKKINERLRIEFDDRTLKPKKRKRVVDERLRGR